MSIHPRGVKRIRGEISPPAAYHPGMHRLLLPLLLLGAAPAPQDKTDFASDRPAAFRKAASEWRPVLVVLHGDAAGKESASESRKTVAAWFEKAELRKAAAPYVVTLLAITQNKDYARELGISSGPYAVVYDAAEKLLAKQGPRDAAGLASWISGYSRDYQPSDPKWRTGFQETLNGIHSEKSRNVLLAIAAGADALPKLEEALRHRRLVVPLRRSYLVRLDPEKDAGLLGKLGMKAGQAAVYRPADPPADPPRALAKPFEWSGDAKKLQELLLGVLKAVDEGK